MSYLGFYYPIYYPVGLHHSVSYIDNSSAIYVAIIIIIINYSIFTNRNTKL
ncbi:hypothetical protein VAE122_740003 [Vibrio aestuarianus]|nr:hypothetical protein VAE122_740003 [Vibrio aestuarianus]